MNSILTYFGKMYNDTKYSVKEVLGVKKCFLLKVCLLMALLGGVTDVQPLFAQESEKDYYTVTFYVDGSDGSTLDVYSQMLRKVGANETIADLPEPPFISGKIFNSWKNKNTSEKITEETVVDGDIEAVAVFESVDLYTVRVNYYYEDCSHTRAIYDYSIYIVDSKEIAKNPLVVTSPSTIGMDGVNTSILDCNGATTPYFYPEVSEITVNKDELEKADASNSLVYDVKMTGPNAKYTFTHWLKKLDGSGYEQLTDYDELVDGVLNSWVTAKVLTDVPYIEFEKTDRTQITQPTGQEIKVYYTRKKFSLFYDLQGGYSNEISASSHSYGTSVPVTNKVPTREGYSFDGWYLDKGYTQEASSTIEINDNTTLYAKWVGQNVNYTIVYMKEVYDNTTNSTNYIYRSSASATGQVGATVSANDVAKIPNGDGYELDAARNAVSQTVIKADGSAVVYVYYKLIRYTLVFNLSNDNGRINMSGKTYTGSNYKIQNVVLGQNISEYWPSSTSEVYSTATRGDRYFSGWTGGDGTYVTKRNEVVFGMVSKAKEGNIVTYTATWDDDNYARNVEYWLQQPDGSYAVADEYTLIGVNSNSLGAKDIAGYTKRGTTPSGYTGDCTNNRTCCVTVHVKEYSFVDTYVDNGGHDTPEPSVKTMTRDDHVYTFVSSTMGTSSHVTSGHASSVPSAAERTIEVGGIIYSFVNSTVDSHEETIEAECTKRNNIGRCQQWKSAEPSITRNGHTYLYVRQYEDNFLGWTTRHYVYSYTDYKYNYTNTSYTYTWVSKEDESTRDITNCGYTYRFYYDRLKYSIKYYNGSAQLQTKSNIMFGANINNGTYNYVPEKPAGKADYTWGGWYAQPELVDKYVFDVMPSSDLALYAKWIAPHYTVRYDKNAGESEIIHSEEVDRGATTQYTTQPQRDGYTFLGWFTEATGGRQYLIGKEQVTEDITLYAHWKANPVTYTVRYINDETDEPVFSSKTVTDVTLKVGDIVTEQALSIAGMVPDKGSVDLTLTSGENVVIFRYGSKQEYNSYTVRYVLADNPTIEVHAPIVVNNVPGATARVTALPAAVDKAYMTAQGKASEEQIAATYFPDANSKSTTLGLDASKNEIVFKYSSYRTGQLNVKWVDMDGDAIVELPAKKLTPKLNTTQMFDDGFESVSDLYVFNHIEVTNGGATTSDVNPFYTVKSAVATYEVQVFMKKRLYISADKKWKVYDGEELCYSQDEITESGLMPHDEITSVTFSKGGCIGPNVDSTLIVLSDAVVTHEGPSHEKYYDITYQPGLLVIRPREVIVSLNPIEQELTYDGKNHKLCYSEDKIVVNYEKYKNAHLSEIVSCLSDPSKGFCVEGIDANTYTKQVTQADLRSCLPEDNNYKVSVNVSGITLTITPAPLTVTTSSAIKAYDGTPLTKTDGAEITGFVNGETATLVVIGSQTKFGSSVNGYKIIFKGESGASSETAKRMNYEVTTETLGELEIFDFVCKDYSFLSEDGSVEFPLPTVYADASVDEWNLSDDRLKVVGDKISGKLPFGSTHVEITATYKSVSQSCPCTILVLGKRPACE